MKAISPHREVDMRLSVSVTAGVKTSQDRRPRTFDQGMAAQLPL